MQDIVNREVDKQLEGMEFYSNSARELAKIGLAAVRKEPTPLGMKTVMDGMKTGMIVEGLVPFYPNAALVNNTNAQQINQSQLLKEIAECLPD